MCNCSVLYDIFHEYHTKTLLGVFLLTIYINIINKYVPKNPQDI
jgi:hypothetical protein